MPCTGSFRASMPLSLDTLGLADTLENLVRDWQRRHPAVALSLQP